MKLLTKNQNGFTLVELLIALVIFAVGILGIGAMQLTAIKGNSKGRLISEASNLAADQIEIFMSPNYGTLTDGGRDINGDGVNDISWTVDNNVPEAGFQTIKVIVDPPGNNTGSVEMTYIKYKYL